MSYHITILRTAEGRNIPITEEEFVAAVESTPGLQVDRVVGKAEYHREGRRRATLMLQEGEIWTAVAEPDVIAVMLQLAERLGARVRGDEFETYRTPEEMYLHPDDREAQQRAEARNRVMQRASRTRQWVAHACIFATFVVLIMIVNHCSRR